MEKVDTSLYLEPCKYYQHFLKDQHRENIDKYLASLVEKSQINTEENKQTVKEYLEKCKESDELAKKIGKNRGFSGFLLFIGILLCVVIIGIFILIYRKNKIKAKIADLQAQKAKVDKKKNELLERAKIQVAPLLNLMDDQIAIHLAEMTAPILDFDERCEPERVDRMVKQFGYDEDDNIDHSTLVIQSGELNGNPFILRQTHVMNMVPHVYTGTLVITWTTVEYVDKRAVTVTHTQTLVAHVSKPKPAYSVQTDLVLASDAAPKLSFSRSPAGLDGKSEREVEKYVKKFEKEDQKRAEKAIKKGGSYTKMANSTFEAYFNSENRNDEKEYRLMFTPLAQNNIVYLFSQTEPFGDDIHYYKNKCLNTIYSAHSANMDYSGGSYNYDSYDFEIIREKFTNYNMRFFNGLYFDFLPLLSIPIFHQHTPLTYIPHGSLKRNVSMYEAECLVNKVDPEMFKHPDSATDVIIKVGIVHKGKDFDQVDVVGYTFDQIEDVEFVPTLGGDGLMHPVPVPYYIYNRLEEHTPMSIYKNAVPKGTESIIMKYRKLFLSSK